MGAAERSAPAPLRVGEGRDPDFWSMAKSTYQGKDSLFKNKCGKLSLESPWIVIFTSFSDKDGMLNLGKFNDFRAFEVVLGWKAVFPFFQFQPDSTPIFMC